MRKQKLAFILCFLLFLLPIIKVKGNSDYIFNKPEKIEVSSPIFFLFPLDVNESVQIQISREKIGNISLFIFDTRPINSYIYPNLTLNPDIFVEAIDQNISQNPFINYTASQNKIFYIEILIFTNGSDIITIKSTKALTRYYLPQIPGFPLFIIIGTLIFPTLLLMIYRKRYVIMCNF
ncbi:MAG: hypothetical protein ACQERB_14310 [Promethearchaeati archaeon]